MSDASDWTLTEAIISLQTVMAQEDWSSTASFLLYCTAEDNGAKRLLAIESDDARMREGRQAAKTHGSSRPIADLPPP